MSVSHPLPPEAPLAMVPRPVRGAPRGARTVRADRFEVSARAASFGGALALTVPATWSMAKAVSSGSVGPPQVAWTVLFALTFGWIAFAGTSALAGCLFYRKRPRGSGELMDRTALVMPVYNEDPAAPMAALCAMAEGLARLGHGARFEVFIASDTQRPETWLRETAAVARLRVRLKRVMPVWYRRRNRNTAAKSGNVEEFVRRFGARFDAMVMLDADSLMSPETLVDLSRSLRQDPNLGLLQTVPRLVGARGFLPRLQQFASAIYGPAIARGVAAWQGPDGNYWGHNAIIRMGAFAEASGLPVLQGKRPFGGPIQSHDFAEAAWMRRAGWSVRMDPELGGSFEEGPPTLLDLLQRDRRWMQGNLQHTRLLGASGLSLVSRFHLASGIAGYLMSPLWLGLMLVGAVVAVQVGAHEPHYFTEPHQLVPHWPMFDAAAMVRLFVLSMGVLLLPKLLGLGSALVTCLRKRAWLGSLQLVASALLELLASALYAPVCMAVQTRQFLEILLRRASGWSVQNRGGNVTPWGACLRRHGGHAVLGVVLLFGTRALVPDLLLWVFPALLGLMVAVPMSRLSGSQWLGQALGRVGMLLTPEEVTTPKIVAERDALIPYFVQGAGDAKVPTLRDLAASQVLRERHFVLARPAEPVRGEPNLGALSAAAKVLDARTWDELESWLTPPEVMALASDEELFQVARALASSPAPGPEHALGLGRQSFFGSSLLFTRSRQSLPPIA